MKPDRSPDYESLLAGLLRSLAVALEEIRQELAEPAPRPELTLLSGEDESDG